MSDGHGSGDASSDNEDASISLDVIGVKRGHIGYISILGFHYITISQLTDLLNFFAKSCMSDHVG